MRNKQVLTQITLDVKGENLSEYAKKRAEDYNGNLSEYIRNLIRQDKEQEQRQDKNTRRIITELMKMSEKEKSYLWNFILLMKDIRKG